MVLLESLQLAADEGITYDLYFNKHRDSSAKTEVLRGSTSGRDEALAFVIMLFVKAGSA